MYDLALHFLLWDLAAAAVLAVVLGVLVVVQGAYRRLVSLVRRAVPTRHEAMTSVSSVRIPAARLPEVIGSRR